jgi:glucose-6-phosphate 1-epimerase
LRCDDIHDLGVEGFQHVQYIDKLGHNDTFTQNSSPIAIDREIDRIYLNATRNIKLLSQSSQQVLMEIEKKASLDKLVDNVCEASEDVACDCVLWNPWVDKSRGLADLDDEGYLTFVCVEPGTVARPMEVPPHHTLRLYQSLLPTE